MTLQRSIRHGGKNKLNSNSNMKRYYYVNYFQTVNLFYCSLSTKNDISVIYLRPKRYYFSYTYILYLKTINYLIPNKNILHIGIQ